MLHKANTVHFFFIGSVGVGKSAIIQQILQGAFITEHQPTQYTSPTAETRLAGQHVTFWDTRGSDKVHLLGLSVPPGRCALVFVYDITDEKSFHHAERSISKFRDSGFANPIILLGNKIDKESQRNVRKESVEAYSSQAIIGEASATTQMKAEAPFVWLLRNKMFMRQLEKVDGIREDGSSPCLSQFAASTSSRNNATLTRRTRSACLGTLFLWLQRLFSAKDKAFDDQIGKPELASPTVRQPENPSPSWESILLPAPPPSRESKLLPALSASRESILLPAPPAALRYHEQEYELDDRLAAQLLY